MTANADWFIRVREAVGAVVGEHGGAIIMTQAELRDSITKVDTGLLDCPSSVLTHIQCPLKYQNLACSAYRVRDNSILLIHDMRIGVDEARACAEEDGLSEAVQIMLFEAHVAEVHA